MAMTPQMIAACLLLASQTYKVPPAVMIAIMNVEAGHVGQQVRNSNGTYDLGPMQVNTIWMPQLARLWNVDTLTAHSWVRDNGCVNVYVSAWILRQKIDQAGFLHGGIARYHSATPSRGQRYADRVIGVMERKGLVAHGLQDGAPPKTAERRDKRGVKVAKADE